MQNDLYYAYKRSLSNRFCTCSVYGPMPLSKYKNYCTYTAKKNRLTVRNIHSVLGKIEMSSGSQLFKKIYSNLKHFTSLSICSDKCEIVHVFMFEVLFDRNGAKAYVKNLRVLSQEKSAKRGFLPSPSHSSTASGTVCMRQICLIPKYPNYCTVCTY
jgi:hypothetical protein